MRSGVAGIAERQIPVAFSMACSRAGAPPSMGSSPTPLAPKGPCLVGFSIRMVEQYQIGTDQNPSRLDILIGAATIQARLAARIWG